MAKDLVIELKAQNKDLKQKLQESKRELSEFKRAVKEANSGMSQASGGGSMFDNILKKITGSAGGASGTLGMMGGGLTKLAGVFGVAMGAAELFNATIASSNDLGDEMEKIQMEAGSAVNYFASCLANVDFSNFWEGMSNAINQAGRLAEMLDEINSELRGLGVRSAERGLKIAELEGKAAGLSRSDPKRQEIYNQIKELQMEDIKETKDLGQKMAEASITRVASAAGASAKEEEQYKGVIMGLLRNRSEDDIKKIDELVKKKNKAGVSSTWASIGSPQFGGNADYTYASKLKNEAKEADKALKDMGVSAREAQVLSRLYSVSDNSEEAPLTKASKEYANGLNMQAQAQSRLNSTIQKETILREKMKKSAGGGSGKKNPVYTEGASAEETIKENIKYLEDQKAKVDINSEAYQVLSDRIQAWKNVLEGIKFGSLDYLNSQLKQAQESLGKMTIGTEEFKDKIEEIRGLQEEIKEAMTPGLVADPKTIEEIERNVSLIQSKIKKTVPDTAEWQKLLQMLGEAVRQADLLNSKVSTAQAGSVEALSEQVNNIQKRLDTEPLTWDMRVNLLDQRDDLNNKIQEMQSGVKPAIQAKSVSRADQGTMQSYENANANAQTIKQQYEIGMIGYDQVKMELDALNKQLTDMGLEPLEIKITSKGARKAQKAINGIADCLEGASDAFSALGAVAEDPALDVAGIIAGAIANIMFGYAQATTAATSMGPWAWIAFAIAGLATAMSAVSSIKSATDGFATGGIVGGSSYHGDNLYARVNSGEMILNGHQQRNLFDAINEGNLGGSSGGGEVSFVLRGADLYGSLKNYGNMKAKAGKTIKLG